MCAKKHTNSKFLTVVRQDGIVSFKTKDANSTIVLADFDELYTLLSDLEKKIGLLLLFDISNNPKLDKQSRGFIYSKQMTTATKALAISSSNPLNNLLGNFLATQPQESYPVRLFSNEDQASQWLLEYNSLPDDRLDAIVALLNDLSALKFRRKIALSDNQDIIDVIGFGLNMLSEEFEFILEEKSQLQIENLNLHESIVSNNLHSHNLNRFARILIANSEGIIENLNTENCKLSNFSKDELVGQSLFDTSTENNERIKLIWNALNKGDSWRGDQQQRTKDGTYFWVDNNIIPINDGKLLVIQIDITDRKEAEKKLLFQVAIAQGQQKEMLGSIITKEITTTLTGLQYLLKSLDDKIKVLNDREMKMLITSIRKNFEHIIGNSKKISSQLSHSETNKLGLISDIESFIKNAEGTFPHKISLQHDIDTKQELTTELETLIYMLVVTISNYIIKNTQNNKIKASLNISTNVEISISTTGDTINITNALRSEETEILSKLITYYNGVINQHKKDKTKTGITVLFPSSSA